MKRQLSLLVLALTLGLTSLHAQETRQRPTVEDKTKLAMSKLAAYDLDAAATAKIKTIFDDYFTAQQTAMQEARATAGGADRAAMKEKREHLVADRNAKLREVLTAEQYEKWATSLEPQPESQRKGREKAKQ